MFLNLLSVKAYRAPLEGYGACADGESGLMSVSGCCAYSLLLCSYSHTHTCCHESWNEKGSQGEDRPQLVECLPGMPRSNLQVQGIIQRKL